MRTTVRALLLHPDDDVVQLLEPAAAGSEARFPGGPPVVAAVDVPMGHKLAVRDVAAGEVVRKYGEPIGVATTPIRRGDHVHVHNVQSARAGAGAHA